MSDYFTLQRGCRQGDPISPYICILCIEVLGKMIRNDKVVNGIRINGKEIKLSICRRHSSSLDGSQESMKQLMYILQTFYKMSGLKVNEEKTRALWFVSMSMSKKKKYHKHDLNREQKPLKILGVTFTADVSNVWEYNAEDIINKINILINNWSKRKLTLPGKITLMKSLMLAKFTHLFLALPNPPRELIKMLQRAFYKFFYGITVQQESVEKNIVKNIKAGGLRMINVSSFITALKVSWLRTLIIFSNNDSFSHFSRLNCSKLYSLGDVYSAEMLKHIHISFWKNIVLLESWKTFLKSFEIGELEIISSHLWENSQISGDEHFMVRQRY